MKKALVFAALVMASSAQASNWGSFSDWDVTGDESDHTCNLGREFEGPGDTVMGLFANAEDRSVTMFILNYNWSIKKGDTPRIGIRLDNVLNGLYDGKGYGFSSDGRNGFGLKFASLAVLGDFAEATGVKFFKLEGEGNEEKATTIDYLDLDGTAAAVGALRRCLSHQEGLIRAAQRERDRWKHIPKNPFNQ